MERGAFEDRDGWPDGASLFTPRFIGHRALFDLSLFWRRKLQPRQRVARHLWRMVMAYFLAATSLFLGQQDDVFPFMQGSPILLIPSLATLAFLTYWVVRVRFVRNWIGVQTTQKVT